MKQPRTPPTPQQAPALPATDADALAWLVGCLPQQQAELAMEEDSKRRLGGEPAQVLAGQHLFLHFSPLRRRRQGEDYYVVALSYMPGTSALPPSECYGRGTVAWSKSTRLEQTARSLGIHVVKAPRNDLATLPVLPPRGRLR